MKTLLRIPLLALIYLCMATLVAESALLGVLWSKGGLRQEQLLQLLAVAYDQDLAAMWRELKAEAQPIKEAQVSYEEVLTTRSKMNLNLDLRQIGAEKGLNDIRQLRDFLEQKRSQYDQVKLAFDQRMQQLQEGAADQALQDLQHQLVSIRPQLAKDQILRMLDDPEIDPDTSLQFVVTILKGMPFDMRKKILAEFKNEDTERLHEILTQIRRGVPDVELIRQTRRQLEQFDTRP